jgi:hypothetical protein
MTNETDSLIVTGKESNYVASRGGDESKIHSFD